MNKPITTESEAMAEGSGTTVRVEPEGRRESVGVRSAGMGSVEQKLRSDAALNRRRVLAAAAEVFAERGLEASLDDVAHAAGVGVGTVYRRFPNKEALVDALFEDKVENMVVLAREAAAFDDGWEGFVHFLQRALEWQVRNRGMRDVLLHRDFACARTARVRDTVAPILTDIIERAQAAGKLRPDVVVNDIPMLVTMLGAVSDYVGVNDPELWQRYMILILDGLTTCRAAWTPLGRPPSQAVVEAAMNGCR